MLTKLIDTSSFYSQEELQVQVIDLDHSDLLEKTAADSRIMDFARNIKAEASKIYLHILAMGAGEYFGSNRNSDYFPEDNLKQWYRTFETGPAHVFRNHVNKDPAIAIGQVLYAIYNERMHRVELVAEVDVNKAPDIKERIEQGDWPFTSMACRTPFDVCSICGNKAKTRLEYCTHISNDLGKILPDGRKVQALNVAPLYFFDISIVFRPADVTSSVLQKLASTTVTSSVDEAEALGLDRELVKKSSLKKLADLIKELDGDVVGVDSTLEGILSQVHDPNIEVIKSLRNYGLNEVLSTFAHMGISPSVEFLAELIAQSILGEEGVGLGQAAAESIQGIPLHELESNVDFGEVTEPNAYIAKTLKPMLPTTSLLPDFVEKRAFNLGYGNSVYNNSLNYYGPMGNVGYVNHSSRIDERPMMRGPMYVEPQQRREGGWFKALLSLGTAAIAAKWYISQAIEAKMREDISQRSDQGVKIVLVKSASDYRLTHGLAMASLKLSLNRRA